MHEQVSDVQVGDKTFRVFDNKLNAPAIVFLHGNSGCWQHWQAQIDYFLLDYRIVAFDQIGYGLSSPIGGDYSMMRQFEDTKELLQELAIDHCHIVGLSMGGACAQLFGLHSDVAISLCLAGIFRYDEMHPEVVRRYREIAEMTAENPDPGRDFFAEMMFGREFNQTSAEKIDQVLAGFFKTDVVAAAALATPESLAEIGQKPASQIKVPCLVVAADEDTLAPLPAAKELHEAIPNSSWCLLEGSGHMMNMEKPAEFNEALSRFYREIAAPG